MEFKFKTEPYAHQLDVFNRLKNREKPYYALFADMGTGKTKITLDVAAYKFLDKQIDALMVIAPNHVHEQWALEQARTHCAVPYDSFIWRSGLIGRPMYKRQLANFTIKVMPMKLKIFAVNVEAFQSNTIEPYIADFVQSNKCLIVIDEATRIKHDSAKRTKLIHKLEKYGTRMILTGTPATKSPFDLWSQMEFLKSNYFGCNYFIFQHRYGIMMKGVNPYSGGKFTTLIDEATYAKISSYIKKVQVERNGTLMPDDYDTIASVMGVSEKNIRFIEGHPTFTRFKRLDELRDYMRDDVFSIRKEDCLDLPPKVYEKIFVTLSDEQKRIYKNLKTELLAEYEGHELTIQNKVALTLRLMQVIGGFFPYMADEERIKGSEHYIVKVGAGEAIGVTNPKYEALKADLDEVAEGTKIIVWAHFVAELKYLYKELSRHYKCCLFYGGTSDRDRAQIIKDFQQGEYDIFIGNLSTAGFGLNLQIATLQYFFSNTFKVEERLQGEDRSHRIGVESAVVYKDIIVKGTIDEKIYQNIAEGRELNDYFKQVSLEELFDIKDTDDLQDEE